MGIEELKLKLEEQEMTLQQWRDEEKSDKTDWNLGYNDGFEDAINALKKVLEA